MGGWLWVYEYEYMSVEGTCEYMSVEGIVST